MTMEYGSDEEDYDWGYSMSNHPWKKDDSIGFLEFPIKLGYASASSVKDETVSSLNDLKDILCRNSE